MLQKAESEVTSIHITCCKFTTIFMSSVNHEKRRKGGKNVLSLIGKVSKTWKIFLDLKRKGIDLH